MTTQITVTPVAEPITGAAPAKFRHLFRPGGSFNLLLAIQDDDNARAAIRLADELTVRGAVPSVLTATQLLQSASGPDAMLLFAEAALGEDFHSQHRMSLYDLVSAATGKAQDWRIESVAGDASVMIVEAAESQHSELIVMGIH